MKLDTMLVADSFAQVSTVARAAEEVGFDALWSVEAQHEPFMPLAIASNVTSKLKLGTAIAVAFPRSPMITAQTAWDLQASSNGRFILGLGTQVKGHNERRFSVKWEGRGYVS
jgi:alkanesulfonate monooxygenase SsuD/methylene tetrahydromethanopterin reductase-like flavin-dependent oxidoreductase (luciferase family)